MKQVQDQIQVRLQIEDQLLSQCGNLGFHYRNQIYDQAQNQIWHQIADQIIFKMLDFRNPPPRKILVHPFKFLNQVCIRFNPKVN